MEAARAHRAGGDATQRRVNDATRINAVGARARGVVQFAG
jgi:hypothetical protein